MSHRVQRPVAKYNAHETDRMRELDGAQLASFTRRATAFALDLVIGWVLFVVLFVVVLLILRVTVGPLTEPASDDPVQLNFFKNWTAFCGGFCTSDWRPISGTGEHPASGC